MSDLKVERKGDVLVLTFDRPERLNALSADMKYDMLEILRSELETPRARAIVITGAGRGFCSGADLELETILARIPTVEHTVRAGMNEVIRLLRDVSIPVIAAVNGPAAGAGCSIALAADIILASESAKFALTFSRIGLVLDCGASQFLAQKIGTGRAAALAMTGDAIDAATALDWGLAYKVYDDATLMDEAMALAERLATGPSLAHGMIKHELSMAQNASLEEVMKFEASCQARAFASQDFREGVEAFTEKRKPMFKGN